MTLITKLDDKKQKYTYKEKYFLTAGIVTGALVTMLWIEIIVLLALEVMT